MSEDLELLRRLVKAHEQVHPRTGGREPIMYFKHAGGGSLQHHGFDEVPSVDETALEDLHSKGLVDVDYREHSMHLTPSIEGRRLIDELERAHDVEPKASVELLLEAIKRQTAAENKLAWPAVRPVLAAMRRYWEEAGFPDHGVGTLPLLVAIPEGTEGPFRATVRTLTANDYLAAAGDLSFDGLPAFVTFTERAFAALDGWPGASNQDLVDNLVAVLTEHVELETVPEKKRRLERTLETIRELGVATAGDVLSKVLTGGV